VVRGALAVPLIVLWTALLGGPALLGGLLDRSGRSAHSLTRLWARLILLTIGVRVQVLGRENIVAGPAVYAANHASALDIPVLFASLPFEFRIIHKRSLYLIPVVGWFLFLAGHIGIDRKNPFRARRSLEAAAQRVRRGATLVVFPEGTRSPDATIGPFKRGSFVLALSAGVPVVPVSLIGVKRAAPHGILSLQPGTVHVKFLPSLPTAGRKLDEAEQLAEEVRSAVISGTKEIP
jgi:1-acyl-sn-glycerol-3-phosphate acyltransferase